MNRSAQYTITLNNQVLNSLEQTEKAALRVDNVMGELNKTMTLFGVAFGASKLIQVGEDFVQASADYEQAMLRIENSSVSAREALKNNLFITTEVDKFKIDLQQSADAYGDFLIKIRNSGLTGDDVRKLHDEVLLISKVTATPQSKMDAAVRDIGIMLGEGVLEARHLRALSYVMPQIIPYIAEELHLSKQELSGLISSGKLTKSAIDSRLILDAVERYSESLESKLPSSLNTINSELNVLHNYWLRFKNDLVLGDKPELIKFLHDLEDGIKYLSAHSEEIIKIIGGIIELLKLYAEWRLALFALQAPFGIISFFKNEMDRLIETTSLYNFNIKSSTSSIIGETEAIYSQTTAVVSLSEAYNVLYTKKWTTAGGTYFSDESGLEVLSVTNLYAKRFGLKNQSNTLIENNTEESSDKGIGFFPIFNFVTAIGSAIYALDQFTKSTIDAADGRVKPSGWDVLFPMIQVELSHSSYWEAKRVEINQKNLELEHPDKSIETIENFSNGLNKYLDIIKIPSTNPFEIHLPEEKKESFFPYISLEAKRDAENEDKSRNKVNVPDLSKASSHIRGNSVTNIHIDIHGGLNGLVNPHFTVSTTAQMEDIEETVGTVMTKILTDVINDAQYLH